LEVMVKTMGISSTLNMILLKAVMRIGVMCCWIVWTLLCRSFPGEKVEKNQMEIDDIIL